MQASDLCGVLEEQYFGQDMHERDEIEHLPALLEGVSIFVDVGASLGQYSFFANQILRNAKIFCIEADPIRFQRLKQLSSQWAESSTNEIVLVHAAATEKDGKVNFFTTNTYISGGLFAHYVVDPELRRSVEWIPASVNGVSLDGLFKDTKPDFVKINVEGSEYSVLLGAREILKRGDCRFLVEVHPWGDKCMKSLPADIFRLFEQFGYDFRRIHRHWLFQKGTHPLKRFLKYRAVIIVMGNDWLKRVLKRCVLAVGSLTRTKARNSAPRGSRSG